MKKTCIALLTAVLLLSMAACGADPYRGLSDEEKLPAVGTWERLYSPGVTMTFNEDNSGYQLNDGFRYDYFWVIKDGELLVDITDWWPIVYTFKMGMDSFEITNTEGGTTATFVYGGTQPTEIPKNAVLPKELVGEWKSPDTDVYTIVFEKDGTGYRFVQSDSTRAHVSDFYVGIR